MTTELSSHQFFNIYAGNILSFHKMLWRLFDQKLDKTYVNLASQISNLLTLLLLKVVCSFSRSFLSDTHREKTSE